MQKFCLWILLHITPLKGIVFRDWGRLLMMFLDRSKVRTIPLDSYFSFKFILNSNFFKLSFVRVRFSPGFPLGGWFPAEQNTHVELCVNRIPPEQKNGFLRCSACTAGAKTRQFALQEIPLSAEIRIPPEQFSPEHPPPKSSRPPMEEPHFVALSAGATSPLLLRSLATTLEQLLFGKSSTICSLP
jgi:hypothetical protein